MKMRAILFVLAIGCGGSSTKPAVQEPKPDPVAVEKPPAPTCTSVADTAVLLVSREAMPPPEAEIKATADAIKNRCEADQWTAEARECFGTAENEADFKGCTKLLTEAQMTAVEKDAEATSPSKQDPPEAKTPAPERRSRGGTPKKQVPKSSDPCMGGE